MSAKRRSKAKTKQETDLFGEPVRPTLPLRKIVERPDGRGWCIAVREPHETLYRYVGVYPTRGDAVRALLDGVGKPIEDVEIVTITVRRIRRQ